VYKRQVVCDEERWIDVAVEIVGIEGRLR